MYNIEENFSKYTRDIGSNILFSPLPGTTVKEVRKGIEVSQERMAQLLGVRRETVSRIETGAINPTAAFIKKFTKIVSTIKVFRDINALRDTHQIEGDLPLNPTFIKTHLALTSAELDALMNIGSASYRKTKKKILRRIRI